MLKAAAEEARKFLLGVVFSITAAILSDLRLRPGIVRD
jgi:hypothetical protein